MNQAYQTIDITDWKQNTLETLAKAIEDAVADTQRVVIRELPNRLVMTPAQYDILQEDPMMQKFYKSNEHVYVTKHNAMDVIIRGFDDQGNAY